MKRGRHETCQKFAKTVVAGLAVGLGHLGLEAASQRPFDMKVEVASGAARAFLSTPFLNTSSSMNLNLVREGPREICEAFGA